MTKTYSLTGVVWGNNWGGGKSGYRATTLQGSNKKALLKKAQAMLDDGSLDSGMGFESLYGAVLTLGTKNMEIIQGKVFYNDEYEEVILGSVTDEEYDASNDTWL